jgi:CubicO group peptidase (beta-lactamase class C family)
MRSRNTVVRWFASTLLLPGLASAAPPSAKQLPDLTQKIERMRKQFFVPGLSVAVVQDDRIVYIKGFGLRDVASRKPVTPDTVFAIGSSSKAFTCLLATQAAHDGLLDLSKSPSYYLPTFKPQGPDQATKLTVSDLLCHRSGYPRTDFAFWAGGFGGDDIITLLNQSKPINRVGQVFLYQNLMVTLAGMIDAKVYGEPYADLVADKIFRPLGMTSTSARTHFLLEQQDHSTGYEPAGPMTEERPLDLHNVDNIAPAGAIVSSAKDMAQWLRLQLANGKYDGKQLFAPEAVLEQRKPRITVAGDMKYGYGWFLSTYHGTTQIDHGGNIDGFNAEVSFLPEKHIGVVVLTNVSQSPLAAMLATTVYDELVPHTIETTATLKSTYKNADPAVVGKYVNDAIHLEVSISQKGDKWSFSQGPVTLPLKLIDNATYAFDNPAAPPVRLSFAPSEKDPKAIELVVEQSGNKFRFKKAPPYKAPMTPEALIAKAVQARGGAANFAKIGNMTIHYHSVMTSEAVTLCGIRYHRNGDEVAEFNHAYALGRFFASLLSYATPDRAGVAFSTVRSYPAVGATRAALITGADVLALLHPERSFTKLTISSEEKVGKQDCYVLECYSPIGSVVKYWVSKSDFLVLKREDSAANGANTMYSDYRTIDGVVFPWREVATSADGAETVSDVDSVDFTSRIPDWPFKAPDGGKL